jgi:hypothetical protein
MMIKVDTRAIREEALTGLTREQKQLRREEVQALVLDMRENYASIEAYAARVGDTLRAPVRQPDGSMAEMTATEGFAHYKDTLAAYEHLLERIERDLSGSIN